MNAAPELIPSAVTMVAALAAVLGGFLVIAHFARRYLQRPGGGTKQKLVRVLASHYIGVKKAVTLVEVPGCILVLGVSGDRIQLLTRIDDHDTLTRIRSQDEVVEASFFDHLSKLTGRTKAQEHDE